MFAEKPLNDFLTDVSSSSPTPGGGSVAALAGSLGAALTAMVSRLTIGKKKYADVQQHMEGIMTSADNLRNKLVELVERDSEAFNKVMQAFSLPKETDDEKSRRSSAIQEATKTASLAPLEVMELTATGIDMTAIVAEKGNVNSISDAGVGALLFHAACAGAALNVRINLATLQDKAFVDQTSARVTQIEQHVEQRAKEIMAKVNQALS